MDEDREVEVLRDEESLSGSHLLDSKVSQLDDILVEKLEAAFHKQTSQIVIHDIAKIASEHTPIDLAYAAFRLPPVARFALYDNLSSLEDKAEFLINTDSSTRSAIFRNISDEEGRQVVMLMPPDEAVHVLEDVSERRFRRILEMLPIEKSLKIREIKKHDRHTAGRLMTNEFFSFTTEYTIGQAASFIRDRPGIDLTRQIFVVNENGELMGFIPARNLIVNPRDLPLRQVMKPVLHKVGVDTSREEVVDIVERYKIPALPVVGEDEKLLGVITYEDVVEAMEDIADETIASFAGTAEKVSEHEPIFSRFFSRAPWLLVTLLAGIINMTVMASFQRLEQGILAFALLFVPLITGMSGNIGIQCSTVLVRSMAIGALSASSKKDAVMKELLLGLMSAVAFGFMCGLVVFALQSIGLVGHHSHALMVGTIIAAGLTGACLMGAALGSTMPLLFARIGVDPAVASGPIVTAINDTLSLAIYFLIAISLSSFF